ncbi:MAG: hypothetical protein ABI537_15220 [Casimicrobiaceae bacterium]
MRLQATMGVLFGAALLAGCQISPDRDTRFSSPIFNDSVDYATARYRDKPPYILSYPDQTMFFVPIYDGTPRSDLNLQAISCSKASDGTLVVNARVQNLGAFIIPPQELLTGDVGSFRVTAQVTWSGGATEEVAANLPIPMTVSGVVNMQLHRTRYFAKDVVSIDVIVDPDRVVPDPVRLNNALSWKGTMTGDTPRCDITRT